MIGLVTQNTSSYLEELIAYKLVQELSYWQCEMLHASPIDPHNGT